MRIVLQYRKIENDKKLQQCDVSKLRKVKIQVHFRKQDIGWIGSIIWFQHNENHELLFISETI